MNNKQLFDEILAMIKSLQNDTNKLQIVHQFLADQTAEDEQLEEFEINIPKEYKKVIAAAANALQTGEVCFINKDTLEIESIFKDLLMSPEEYEDATGEKLILKHENWDNYHEIYPLDSDDSFKIMEGFISQVKEKSMKSLIIDTLENSKPFANFRRLIDNSNYREQWFEYRFKKTQQFIWDMYFFEEDDFEN